MAAKISRVSVPPRPSYSFNPGKQPIVPGAESSTLADSQEHLRDYAREQAKASAIAAAGVKTAKVQDA
jgi:hypothetical protein